MTSEFCGSTRSFWLTCSFSELAKQVAERVSSRIGFGLRQMDLCTTSPEQIVGDQILHNSIDKRATFGS